MPEAVQLSEVSAVDFESLATDVVKLATKAGASDAEAVVREGDEFSVNVRMGQVEREGSDGVRWGCGCLWGSVGLCLDQRSDDGWHRAVG